MPRITRLITTLALLASIGAVETHAQDYAFVDDAVVTVSSLHLTLDDQEAEVPWHSMVGGERAIETDGARVAGTNRLRASVERVIRPVTLKRFMTGIDEAPWLDWLNRTLEGRREALRQVTATLVDANQQAVERRVFNDAFPTKYVFPSLRAGGDELLTETLVFHANGFQGPEGAGGSVPGGAPLSEHLITAGNFVVEGSELPQDFISVEIEDLVIPVTTDSRRRRASQQRSLPGEPVYGLVTLERYRAPGDEQLSTLWDDAWSGQRVHLDFSVVLLDRDGGEAKKYTIFDCVPKSYGIGEFDSTNSGSAVTEVLTCRPERMMFE